MATKLKSTIKKIFEKIKSVPLWAKAAFVLWLLYGGLSAFAVHKFIYANNFYSVWYSVTYSVYNVDRDLYLVCCGLLAGAALTAYLYLHFFRSRAGEWKDLKVRTLDQLSAELLLAVSIFAGLLWMWELRSVLFQSESLAGFFGFYSWTTWPQAAFCSSSLWRSCFWGVSFF